MDAAKQDDITEIHPPPARLLTEFACSMRPDWDRWELQDAILAASNANWDPMAVTREVWRLANDPDGQPSELRNSARQTRPRPPTGPEVYRRGAALAREMLGIDPEGDV